MHSQKAEFTYLMCEAFRLGLIELKQLGLNTHFIALNGKTLLIDVQIRKHTAKQKTISLIGEPEYRIIPIDGVEEVIDG